MGKGSANSNPGSSAVKVLGKGDDGKEKGKGKQGMPSDCSNPDGNLSTV